MGTGGGGVLRAGSHSKRHTETNGDGERQTDGDKGMETSESTGKAAMEVKPFNSTTQEEHHMRSTTTLSEGQFGGAWPTG